MNRRLRLREIFAAPLMLAALSLVGLLVALTGDGLRDALAWAAVAAPGSAVLWAMKRRRI